MMVGGWEDRQYYGSSNGGPLSIPFSLVAQFENVLHSADEKCAFDSH